MNPATIRLEPTTSKRILRPLHPDLRMRYRCTSDLCQLWFWATKRTAHAKFNITQIGIYIRCKGPILELKTTNLFRRMFELYPPNCAISRESIIIAGHLNHRALIFSASSTFSCTAATLATNRKRLRKASTYCDRQDTPGQGFLFSLKSRVSSVPTSDMPLSNNSCSLVLHKTRVISQELMIFNKNSNTYLISNSHER